MNTRMLTGLIVGVMVGLVVSDASARKKPADRNPALVPVVEGLLEDVDALNTKAKGNSRDIGKVKGVLDDLERKLQSRDQDVEARMKKLQDALDAANHELAELKSRQVFKGRKLPWLIPTLEVRVRPEFEHNRGDFDSSSDDRDFFVAQRARLGFRLQPRDGIVGVFTIQDARSWAESENSVSDEQSLDLFQAYLMFEDIDGTGVSVQAGRFGMQYGAGRQVATRNFNPVGQVFDGLRLMYKKPGIIKADAFVSLVRNGLSPLFSDDVSPDPYSVFTGVYLTTDGISFLDAELYGFYEDDGFSDRIEKVGTIGARIVGKPVKGLRLEAEAAVQFGKVDVVDENLNLVSADHLATAYFASASYEIAVRTRPTVGVFFYSASGDADPYDNESVAYRPVYPSGHGPLGHMDMFKWQGVWDIGPSFTLYPDQTVRVDLAYHFFSLSSDGGALDTGDYLYSADIGLACPDGIQERLVFLPGQSRFLGQEFDIDVSYKPVEWLALDFGYALFKPEAGFDGAGIQTVRDLNADAVVPTTPRAGWIVDSTYDHDLAHRFWISATLTL